MPEHQRRSRRSPRLLAFCTAAVTVAAGVSLHQVGHADPSPTLEEVQQRVDELNSDVGKATERYHLAGEKLDEVQRRLERAENAISKQEEKVAAALAGMAGYAAATYQTGGIDPTIRTLLADDPVGYLAHASVLDAYASQQAQQVESVAHETRQLEQAKLLADEELARRAAIEEELEAERKTIEKSLAEAEELLNELEEEERERLEEERRRQAEREREQAAEDTSRNDDRDDSDDDTNDDTGTDDPPPNGNAAAVVQFAMAQRGEPYQWGGSGPNSWDCSGLTMMAWRQAGVSLPRSSGSQIGVGTRVSRSQLQPGDLVFYYSPISHVAIYIGNGQIVHATKPGDVVKVSPVDQMPFAGASRPG
ncbi:C40 family peptidase [Phytoactinopolyspora alkaliphila]|uniref:C40 family peptidase n=1 Tax=Phytoactinopolyspora alkaliphila TaxID=1783498 RepID=A0A6N9YTZ4_9ACTN|nr:C40 family peptidase [Phytoactinopolyspora alkaliphila]